MYKVFPLVLHDHNLTARIVNKCRFVKLFVTGHVIAEVYYKRKIKIFRDCFLAIVFPESAFSPQKGTNWLTIKGDIKLVNDVLAYIGFVPIITYV